MTLLAALKEFCACYGYDKTYWIGYSGGLDSHVLLSVCHALRTSEPIKLRAIHINHRLHEKAQSWALHCAEICAQYEIDYVEHAIQVKQTAGKSLEERAREKRYAAFAKHMREGDVLLTAHQQDDQAETLLLQLLRGAGPKGLAAMPTAKTFACGLHLRPFLEVPRTVLRHYADANQLLWIDDESNDHLTHTRNFIRHQILPSLKARWPTVTNAISRSANHCAEAQTLLEEFALTLGKTAVGSQPNTLSVTKLLQMTKENQKLVLRTWIHTQNHLLPNAKKIKTIVDNVLNAACDKMPCVDWGQCELRRFRDDLYLMPRLSTHDLLQVIQWDLKTPLSLPGVGILHTVPVDSEIMTKQILSAELKAVTVQFRRGGESVYLLNRGHRTLKNLFQEWQIRLGSAIEFPSFM